MNDSSEETPVDEPMAYVLGRLEALVSQGDATIGVASRVSDLWDCLRHTPNVMPGDELGVVELVWNRSGWHVEISVDSADVYLWATRTGASHA